MTNKQIHFFSMFYDDLLQAVYIYFDCPNCKAFCSIENTPEQTHIKCPKCGTRYRLLSRNLAPLVISMKENSQEKNNGKM